MAPINKKIHILLPDLRGGGAERLHVHLANDWARKGFVVEFVLMNKQGDLLETLSKGIAVVDLNVPRARHLLWPLTRHLQKTKPSVVIAAMWPLTSISILAWRLAGRPGRLFVSDHSQLTIAAVQEMKVPHWLIGNVMRFTYPLATGVIAVSRGVKDDMCALGHLNQSTVRVIHNPAAVGVPIERGTKTDQIALWGAGFNHHIITVGTLKTQKDHATLIRAFALLPEEVNAKLTILGEGPLRGELEALIRNLGLESRISMPGFVLDPYPWYQTADLFVLSSRWEGFGNVIVEAMECGVPVVSTDCQSGPSEILLDGKVGRLVPVGDARALADAMIQALAAPADRQALRLRAQDFSVSKISAEYLDYFGLNSAANSPVTP